MIGRENADGEGGVQHWLMAPQQRGWWPPIILADRRPPTADRWLLAGGYSVILAGC